MNLIDEVLQEIFDLIVIWLKINQLKKSIDYTPQAANIKDTVALVLYSSGTTGLVKGVQITQFNIMSLLSPSEDSELAFFEGLPLLSVAPCFHVYGCLATLITIFNGIKFISMPKFE